MKRKYGVLVLWGLLKEGIHKHTHTHISVCVMIYMMIRVHKIMDPG